jgi:hypothetical protein
VEPRELAEIKAEILAMIDRAPTSPGASVDRMGRPALGADLGSAVLYWSKPLGDPMGGTAIANGRAPVKMIEPKPVPGLPNEVLYIIQGPLQFSDAALRVYGHPKLLAVAAAVNGEDFVPYNEALIIKQPGQGASFAWHQDGTTHWGKPDWTPISHGFNFMLQLFPCTAANAVWYLPGTHATGRKDIAALIAQAGGNRLPDAVPMICQPGDVAISNRQVLHGSFPNTSPDWRITLNMGFHLRKSVFGVETSVMGSPRKYDDAHIRRRSEIIGYAIDARRQRYPDEAPFRYLPHVSAGHSFQWNEAARPAIREYQVLDMFI